MSRSRAPRGPAPVASTTAPASAWLQPKLSIGAPGDRHEQEADQAADRVMQGGTQPALTPLRAPTVQREDEERKKEAPDPAGEGLGVVAANLGENNPAFGVFTEKLAADFMRQPAELSVGVPVFLGANYAFLWSMAMVNPAMRRNFDDFNLAMLPGLVPQFPVKTFTYRILDSAQTRFEFDFGLDATSLLEAFNDGVLNTHLSSLKFDSSGRIDTKGSALPSLSAMQVQLGLFSDGINLSGGFRNGISPYPLIEPGGSVMAQTPAMPDLQAGRQDVRFTLNLDLVRLYQHFNPGKPNPLGPQIDVAREAQQPAQAPGARESGPAATAAVQSTLAEGGAPLEPATRQFMESRFGHDFGSVRIHADAQAAASAQSVGARAYAVGEDLVFNRGQYQPATLSGRHLLAHELAHVVQQGGGNGLMQRELLSAKDLDDFETDDFPVKTLETYLATHGPGKIEDNNDSDDKARRIVRLWKNKQAPFTQLSAQQKILLIQEMQSGYTGNDDERGILALLLDAPPADLTAIFAAINPNELDSDFHGDEEDTLRDFFDQKFVGGRKSALAGERSLRKAKADEPEVKAPAAAAFEPPKAPGPPRQDYVFIMGVDTRDTFYRDAEGFFRAHRPKAIIVTGKRNLADVLRHVADKISAPIGNLYIVSHANEDGTLMFGLKPRDPDSKLNATELRAALHPTNGSSALAQVGPPQVDQYTVVRIKGCDLGRNGEMLDLLDEAFGGHGTVIAPTHEQTYGTDPQLGDQAAAEFARGDAAFKKKLDAQFPEPPAVDKNLKGKELAAAQKARALALAKRKADIAGAQKQHEAERRAATARGLHFEGFSGPLFQHPGEAKFGADELKPKLLALYPHLSDAQRQSLADRLVKDDPRPEAVARANTTFEQQGQRVYRHDFTEEGFEPANASEFMASQRGVPQGFVPGELTSTAVEIKGVPHRKYEVKGSMPDGGTQSFNFTTRVLLTLDQLAAKARATLNNPDKYEWKEDRQHDVAGNTKLRVTAKRVVAYLHHASLDASLHDHFTRPENDPTFHAKSSFAPPPEKPAP
ncbi:MULTISPECIES: eCIS core domain-containing protein [unclassified Variovorax]|uniref:eCIS core domain-containing protein n=1 Tax=unclassified Variovorax TaxID=663243 RepID=UPI003ECFDEA7